MSDRTQPSLAHLDGSEQFARWDIGEPVRPWRPEWNGHRMNGSAWHHGGSLRPTDRSLRDDTIPRFLSCRSPGCREWLAARRGADVWDDLMP